MMYELRYKFIYLLRPYAFKRPCILWYTRSKKQKYEKCVNTAELGEAKLSPQSI